MKAAYVQQPEDLRRKMNNPNAYQTRSKGGITGAGEGVTRTGPPNRNNPSRIPVNEPNRSTPEKANQNERSQPGVNRARELPYVDVPPPRPAQRLPPADTQEAQAARHVLPTAAPLKPGPAYKSRAPVEEAVDIEKLVETVLDANVTVPLRSLAGASTAVREEIRKQVTRLRKPIDKATYWAALPPESKVGNMVKIDHMPISAYLMVEEVTEEMPEGHFVADDPVLQYLRQVKDGDPGELLVALDSAPIRSIYSVVNRVGQEECLLDNGSQIVSMAKRVAIKQGLTWDPNLVVNMESASNHVEKTLGMARNVAFLMGGLTIYLQVHILENPPYDVLLGRPFEVFTNSALKNAENGEVLLTITDPNTKRQVVMPTYERGESPEDLQKKQVQSF
jgi:hypothetical protein